jgi:hypothetical protein
VAEVSNRGWLVPPAPAPARTSPEPPSFTVVIAAHQSSAVIRGALDSVFAQTYPAAQVVVCDGGSTDDLDAALAPYRARLELLRSGDLGPSHSRNRCAAVATGSHLAFLDDDDEWLPHRLERVAELLVARPDLGMVATNGWYVVNGSRRRLLHTSPPTRAVADTRRAVLAGNIVFFPVVSRRLFERVGGFDESLWRMEDWDCWLRLVLDGATLGWIAEPLVQYRRQPGSLSTNRAAMRLAGLEVTAKALTRDDLSPDERAVAERAQSRLRASLEVDQAIDAVTRGARDARARCARVAAGPVHPVRLRLAFAAASASPRLAARFAGRGLL